MLSSSGSILLLISCFLFIVSLVYISVSAYSRFMLSLGGSVGVFVFALVFDYRCVGILYKSLRPLIFLTSSDFAHEMVIWGGSKLRYIPFSRSLLRFTFRPRDEILKVQLFDKFMCSPIGLAAGMDSSGSAVCLFSSIGFGFESVGTITYQPCEGNPKPRLGRLIKSKSLLVYKGLRNPGIVAALTGLCDTPSDFCTGISIGPTNAVNCATGKTQVEDMENSVRVIAQALKKSDHALHSQATQLAFVELNISCPNNYGPEQLQDPEVVRDLLKRVRALGLSKPVWIKMPQTASWEPFRRLLDVIVDSGCIQGLIIANLCLNRASVKFERDEISRAGKGNFSGRPCEVPSNRLIAKTFAYLGHQLPIIGCGGVFTAQQAYEKIRLGSSAVMLATAIVFEGPQAVAEMNAELAKLLRRDGFKSLKDAIGIAHATSEAKLYLDWNSCAEN